MSNSLTSLFLNFDYANDHKDIVFPSEEARIIARAWYSRYTNNHTIEDDELIELLFFFYSHYDLDCYELSHYIRVAEHLNNTYNIPREQLLDMIASFREFI